MASPDFASVDDYLAAQPPAARRVLTRVRAAIRKGAPGAAESISYRIPTYKLDGQRLLYFAGWKQHFSLYPAPPAIVAALADELAPYEIEKGTIRFPLDAPPPLALITRIAKLRAAELSAPAKKPAKRR